MYDPCCQDLAEHFLPGGTTAQLKYIAQAVQDAVEQCFDTLPCGRCGSYPCICVDPMVVVEI